MVIRQIAERVTAAVSSRVRSLLTAFGGFGTGRGARQRGLEVTYLLFLVLLASGIVNWVLEGSKLSGDVFISNSPVTQTVNETMIYSFTILAGFGGIYLIYVSGRNMMKGRVNTLYFTAGLVVLVVALAIGFALLGIKR